MMQKGKSALSAALRGNAPAADEMTRQPKPDAFSFPCLGGGDNDTVSELASKFQAGATMRGSLAGSAPTATLLSDGSVAVCLASAVAFVGAEPCCTGPAERLVDQQNVFRDLSVVAAVGTGGL